MVQGVGTLERETEAKLKVALEALTKIADETDLTSMASLFRMQRRAEEAILKINNIRSDRNTLL